MDKSFKEEMEVHSKEMLILQRIKRKRLVSIFVAIGYLPFMAICLSNNLNGVVCFYSYAFIMVVVIFPSALSKCPHCGKFFFYHSLFSGYRFWFVNECQRCGFPRKIT